MKSPSALISIELWILYAFGVGLVFTRLISRVVTLGSFQRLQLDDWLMVVIVVPFTAMVAIADESDSSSVSKDAKTKLKMRFALEELQLTTNWLTKACLIILYRRIFTPTTSNRERGRLTHISVYCAVTFVLMQILLPLWCSPLSNYWNQFLLDNQCSTYHNHSILVLILDTTTVSATFILPVAFIPTPRKLLQIALIVLGTLVLVSGILARSFVIARHNDSTYIHWYTIQIVLMILFANLPFLSSLFTSGIRTPRRSMSLTSWPRSRTGSAATVESNVSTLYGSPRSISGDFPPIDFKDVWTDNKTTPPVSPMRSWLRGRESVREIDFNGLAQQLPPEVVR